MGPNSSPAGDLNALRGMNERAVLRILRGGGAFTVAVLAARTGLTRASVVEVVNGLIDKGWVAAEAALSQGRGRPARHFRYQGGAGSVIALDIGAHFVRARLADLLGTTLASASRPVAPEMPRDDRLAAVFSAYEECLERTGTPASQVWLAVAGTTGLVNETEGIVVESAAIPDWRGLHLAEALSQRIPGRVFVENDIRLAATAELKSGVASGKSDVLLLYAGYRIGMHVFLGGESYHGHHHLAGDLSRISLPLHTMDGVDGDRDGVRWELRDLSDRTAAGDEIARHGLREVARDLGTLAGMAAATLDPEILVLSGPLVRNADVVVPALEAGVARYCVQPPFVTVSTLGAEGVLDGAVVSALEHLDAMLLADTSTRVPALSAGAISQ